MVSLVLLQIKLCVSICFSAGVGRTGTYITLDNVLDQIEAEGLVDIDGVITKARNQRMKMVQTKVNRYNPSLCFKYCTQTLFAIESVCKSYCVHLVCC